jgi:hypothetical protein
LRKQKFDNVFHSTLYSRQQLILALPLAGVVEQAKWEKRGS